MIAIPQDANDIGNLGEFSEAIKTINEFQKNLSKFGQKIMYDKYVKILEDWDKILTEDDKKKNNFEYLVEKNSYNNNLFAFDFNNKKLMGFIVEYRGWIMGAETGKELTYSFSDDGKVLIVRMDWQTQSARFDHVPWIAQKEIWTFDLITNEIKIK